MVAVLPVEMSKIMTRNRGRPSNESIQKAASANGSAKGPRRRGSHGRWENKSESGSASTGDISDGDPPDYVAPAAPTAPPVLAPVEEVELTRSQSAQSSASGASGSGGTAVMRGEYEELEDITFASPGSFENMAKLIAACVPFSGISAGEEADFFFLL